MRRKPDTGGASLLKPDDSRTHREKSRVETLQNVCIEYRVDEADGGLFILLAQFLYHLLPPSCQSCLLLLNVSPLLPTLAFQRDNN